MYNPVFCSVWMYIDRIRNLLTISSAALLVRNLPYMYMYLGYTRWPIASWILTEATKQLYTLQLNLFFCLVVLAANFSEKRQQFFIEYGLCTQIWRLLQTQVDSRSSSSSRYDRIHRAPVFLLIPITSYHTQLYDRVWHFFTTPIVNCGKLFIYIALY